MKLITLVLAGGVALIGCNPDPASQIEAEREDVREAQAELSEARQEAAQDVAETRQEAAKEINEAQRDVSEEMVELRETLAELGQRPDLSPEQRERVIIIQQRYDTLNERMGTTPRTDTQAREQLGTEARELRQDVDRFDRELGD